MITSTINFAITGGIELLVDQADSFTNINARYDDVWQSIFVDLSGPWVAVYSIASFVLAYAFIALLMKIVLGTITEQWSDVVQEVAYLLVVVFLLSNNGQALANFALFARDFTNDQVEQIYNINISTVTIEGAINDILLTSQVKSEISNRFRACKSKTGTLQIDCLEAVAQDAQAFVNDAQAQAQANAPPGAAIIQYGQRLATFISLVGQLQSNNPATVTAAGDRIFDGLVESTAVPIIRIILKAIQFALINLIEISRLLVHLFGPIAAALSVIPGKPRAIEAWLFGIIALSSLVWSYVVVVGFSATIISISGSQDTTELGFLIILAIGSPSVAYALSKGGGEALFMAISSASLAVSNLFTKIIFG